MLENIVDGEMILRLIDHSPENKIIIYPNSSAVIDGTPLENDFAKIADFFPEESRIKAWWICASGRLLGAVMYGLGNGMTLRWSLASDGIGKPIISLEKNVNIPIESEVDLMVLLADPVKLLDTISPGSGPKAVRDLQHCGLEPSANLRVGKVQLIDKIPVTPLAA